MKAVIIADDNTAIERFSIVLKSAGYDIIIYRWLVKALDNIEEIAPHLILASTVDYPRHWKTIVQYAKSGIGGIVPQVILYTGKDFPEEEQKKADALGVRGTVSSYDVTGLDELRNILEQDNDIYSGRLSNPENEKGYQFVFSDPDKQYFVTGTVAEYNGQTIVFIPDYYENSTLSLNQTVSNASLYIDGTVETVDAVVKKTGKILEFQIHQNE